MRRVWLVGVGVALCAMQEAPRGEEIVVIGTRGSPEALKAESFNFLRRALGEPAAGQYARWNGPLCFAVSGLGPAEGRMVVRQMAEVAREAGAALAKGRCEPNVAVAFTGDAKAMIAGQLRRNKFLFDEVPPADRATLRDGDRAVRWWYTTRVEGADGRQQGHNAPALISNPWGVVSNGSARYLTSTHSSVIDSKFQASLNSVAMVVDVPRATGVRLQALAQYLAFVALSKTRLTADYGGASTILRLFDGGPSAPFELTEWDRAYLAALYKAAPNRNAHTQRAQIAAEMSRRLSGH